MSTPTISQIRSDNEHFSGEIVYFPIKAAHPDDARDFGFTHYIEVGCTGNKYRAGYNWHPDRKQWELGCN